MRSTSIAIAAASLCLGCSGRSTEKKNKADETGRPAAASEDAAGAAAPAETKTIADLPKLDLPEVDTAPMKPGEAQKVHRLNLAARKLAQAGDYEGAVAKTVEVLKKQPKSINAWYRLSFCYAKTGKKLHGYAVLYRLRETQRDCPACISRLKFARIDNEWKESHDDPLFAEVTEVTSPVPSVEEAAAVVGTIFQNAGGDAIGGLVHPERPVVIEWGALRCTGTECTFDKPPKQARATGIRQLAERLEDLEGRGEPGKVTCGEQDDKKRTCCTYARPERASAHDIYRACFLRDTGDVPFLTTIEASAKR